MQDETMNEEPGSFDHDQPETTEPQQKLSRRKRGAAPVVGMACEPGYKQVGEDCTFANPEFE